MAKATPTTRPLGSTSADPESPGRSDGRQLEHVAAVSSPVVDVAARRPGWAGATSNGAMRERLAARMPEHPADGALLGGRGIHRRAAVGRARRRSAPPGRGRGRTPPPWPSRRRPSSRMTCVRRSPATTWALVTTTARRHDPAAPVLDPAARLALDLHDRAGHGVARGLGDPGLGGWRTRGRASAAGRRRRRGSGRRRRGRAASPPRRGQAGATCRSPGRAYEVVTGRATHAGATASTGSRSHTMATSPASPAKAPTTPSTRPDEALGATGSQAGSR